MDVFIISVFVIVFNTQAIMILGKEERALELERITQECAKELNIGDSFAGAQNVTHEYKCFIKCQFTKMGYVDVEGNTNMEEYKKDYVIDDSDLQAIETCAKDNTDDDLCEKVFMTQTCIIMYFDAKE